MYYNLPCGKLWLIKICLHMTHHYIFDCHNWPYGKLWHIIMENYVSLSLPNKNTWVTDPSLIIRDKAQIHVRASEIEWALPVLYIVLFTEGGSLAELCSAGLIELPLHQKYIPTRKRKKIEETNLYDVPFTSELM